VSSNQIQIEALLQTILAHFERIENAPVEPFVDEKSPFKVHKPATGTVVRYFSPGRSGEFDSYGNPKQLNQ